MMTCELNELVAPIHLEVMITILLPDNIDTWLHGTYDEVIALQRIYGTTAMIDRRPVFSTQTR